MGLRRQVDVKAVVLGGKTLTGYPGPQEKHA
jgi:hypothetical protein